MREEGVGPVTDTLVTIQDLCPITVRNGDESEPRRRHVGRLAPVDFKVQLAITIKYYR